MTISDDEIALIRERYNKSTKGSWRAFIEGRDHESGSSFIMTGIDINKTNDIFNKNRGPDIYLDGATDDDIDFIACAKQDIPKLLKEIDMLKRIIANKSK